MRHGDDASNDWIQRLLKNGKPAPRSPYLEPEDSPFSRGPGMRLYEEMLAASLLVATESESQSLAPAWQQEERAILVCLPSFQPEWTLSVVGNRKAGYWVLLVEAQKSLWYSTTFWYSTAGDPGIPCPPSVNIYRSELAATLGGAVCDIWSRVLSQTRYPPERWSGCDGVTYHFAYCRSGIRGIPERSGKTWSPEEESVPGKLVGLSHALGDYAKDSANQDCLSKGNTRSH
jgi:hypothetical protein